MSRKIKFRIWKKSIKKYIDLTTFTITNDGEITALVSSNIIELVLSKDDYILEQYTGIKDTNGKEIYEGDIVTLCGEWEDIENDDCQVVTFSGGCFRIGDGYESEAGRYLEDWRVIGNIHENPELLEKGAKND